jgi:hypothetical protein
VSAITRLGATPVFADIDPEISSMASGWKRRRRNKTGARIKAVPPVHLFGRVARWRRSRAGGQASFISSKTSPRRSCARRREGRRTIGDPAAFLFSDKTRAAEDRV